MSRKGIDPKIVEVLEWTCRFWQDAGIYHVPVAGKRGKQPDEDFRRKSKELSDLEAELKDCTRCRLCEGRTNLVFGDGNPAAELVFVGEGPGHDEDMQGKPFVGQAGRLLTKMIRAIGLDRSQVYICNVVKCRPPNNRTPQADEIAACSPFMFRQLEIINPKVICLLGACAASTVLRLSKSISAIRGKTLKWRGINVVPTYHPAYLLRNPRAKSKAWEDFKLLYSLLKVPN